MDDATMSSEPFTTTTFIELSVPKRMTLSWLFSVVYKDIRALSGGRILVTKPTHRAVTLTPVALLRPSPESGPLAEPRVQSSQLWCAVLLDGTRVRLAFKGRWGGWLASVLAHRLSRSLGAVLSHSRMTPAPVSLSFHDEILARYGRSGLARYGEDWARFFTLCEARAEMGGA